MKLLPQLFTFTCALSYAFTAVSAETDLTDTKDTVSIAQMRGVPVKWDIDANLATFVEQANAAGKKHPDIFITPECWLDGYAAPDKVSTPEKLRQIAQPLKGSPYLDKVAELAKKYNMWICFGFSSLEDGKLFNASGLWNRDGKLLGVYHKTHIQTHDRQYDLGMGLPVWDSEWGKLGMMICADRRWPETVRSLRVQGARLILNPTYGMHGDWNLKIMQVRAWENQCFIAFTHPKQSLLLDPGGDVLLKVDEETPGYSITTIDLREAKDDNHIQDRRPELYKTLSEGVYTPPEN
jgi:beta-ureidopropionase